jgi:hypothetical protein
MKARKLIEDAAYPPEVLAVACEAFDQAWHKIESGIVSDGDREAARMRLAGIILMLARDSISSLEALRDAAVRVFSLDL